MSQVFGSMTSFVGRSVELAEVTHLLGGTRLLTLTGMGGVGKSRLAGELYAERERTDPDRCWAVELGDLADPALLVHAIAAALDLRPGARRSGAALLTGHVGDAPALLHLDGCEHLLDEVAALVGELLNACAGLVVLVTSQVPLGLRAEVVYPVPPMTASGPAGPDAIALFVERARAALPSFELDEGNADAVAGLVEALAGIPLAIELAAAQVRTLPPGALQEQLSSGQQVLSGGPRDAAERHRSLEASMQWTYDLCSPAEQVLWRRFAVFSGSPTLDAVAAVCADPAAGDLAADALLTALTGLVDRYVVVRLSDEPTRFRLLEPLRRFGARKLDAAGETDTCRDRHLGYHAEVARSLDTSWVGPDQVRWLQLLDGDLPDLRAVLDRASADPASAPCAVEIVASLHPYWLCSGQLAEARHWLERALQHGTGDVRQRARGTTALAHSSLISLDVSAATRAVAEARPLVEIAGDPRLEGHLLSAEALLAIMAGDPDAALPLLSRSRDLSRQTGDFYAEGRVMQIRSQVRAWSGDPEGAAADAALLLEQSEAFDDALGRSYGLWGVAAAAGARGELDRAEAHLRESLEVSWSLRDRFGVALRLETIAWVLALRGDLERATEVVGAARAVWLRMGVPGDEMPFGRPWKGPDDYRRRGPGLHPEAFRRGLAAGLEEAVLIGLGRSAQTGAVEPGSVLTRREDEVAVLVAEGLSNREIATRLFISERTAQGHVQSILRKLGVSSRARIATWVVRRQG